MKELPKGLIGDTLNQRHRRIERGHIDDDTIPRLHVSSIIRSDSNNFFCPREFVLRYMERQELAGAGIPPKFQLLYAVGHFYGEYIVQEFLTRNPQWAQYAWGDWTCPCKQTKLTRVCYPEGQSCDKCDLPVDRYVEVDLFNPVRTVIGHADLIFNVEGRYYIYEFKSIDRKDVVFNDIKRPLGDHLVQASNYYYMLKSEGKDVSRVIRFVYVDRSMDGLYTQKPFKEVYANAIPTKRLSAFYLRAKKARGAIKKGVLPERLCDSITCARAKQCSRAITCFARTKKTIKRVPLIVTS